MYPVVVISDPSSICELLQTIIACLPSQLQHCVISEHVTHCICCSLARIPLATACHRSFQRHSRNVFSTPLIKSFDISLFVSVDPNHSCTVLVNRTGDTQGVYESKACWSLQLLPHTLSSRTLSGPVSVERLPTMQHCISNSSPWKAGLK